MSPKKYDVLFTFKCDISAILLKLASLQLKSPITSITRQLTLFNVEVFEIIKLFELKSPATVNLPASTILKLASLPLISQ